MHPLTSQQTKAAKAGLSKSAAEISKERWGRDEEEEFMRAVVMRGTLAEL